MFISKRVAETVTLFFFIKIHFYLKLFFNFVLNAKLHIMEEFDIQNSNERETTLNYPLIIGLIIGLFLIGGGIYWYLSHNDESDNPEEVVTDDAIQNGETGENPEEKVIDSTAVGQEQNTGETRTQEPETNTDTTTTGTTSGTNDTSETTLNDTTTNVDTQNVYFIVSGAFRDENNAQKKVENLKSAGYNAVIVGQNAKGLYIVAYEGFHDLGSAKTRLNEIRQTDSNAWIYKKKN